MIFSSSVSLNRIAEDFFCTANLFEQNFQYKRKDEQK